MLKVLALLYFQFDPAPDRELDCIGQKVHQHLHQSVLVVADGLSSLKRVFDHETQSLGLDLEKNKSLDFDQKL